jgi:hypothetical protein
MIYDKDKKILRLFTSDLRRGKSSKYIYPFVFTIDDFTRIRDVITGYNPLELFAECNICIYGGVIYKNRYGRIGITEDQFENDRFLRIINDL